LAGLRPIRVLLEGESGRFSSQAAQTLLFGWAYGVENSTARMSEGFLLPFVDQKKPSSSLHGAI
jgi:hypothetical protein